MAYRRKAGARRRVASSSRARASRRTQVRRTSARRAPARRRSSAGPRAIRIVIEQAPAPTAGTLQPELGTVAAATKKARF